MQKEKHQKSRSVFLRGIDAVRDFLGFYRNPPYIRQQLMEADVNSVRFLSAVVICMEIYMLIRYVFNWVLPGKVESLGEFFYYTADYWALLANSTFIFIYAMLFSKGKFRKFDKLSYVLLLLYFLIDLYIGATTAIHDFSRGRMITCFITILMHLTVICIWRPFSSLAMTFFFGFGFTYLLNRFTFDKAGNQVQLSSGDYINYVTFLLSMGILQVGVYQQRYSDAKKSYKLNIMAKTDDLTGLANMREFDATAHEQITVVKEKHLPTPMYLVFNICNFHTYNDRFDYSGGDRLLVQMGEILRNCFPDDAVARESGDIFTVLTGAEDYRERADKARRMLREAYPKEVYLDVKVGACRAEYETSSARFAVDRARYAMKKIRADEDEFFIEYDEKLSKEYEQRQYILNHLDEAIENGYIRVYYQPVTWSQDGTLCGTEALARWIDPQLGFLSPGAFIPVLEESRIIHKLDLCIYENVCRQIRYCMDNNLPVLPTSMNFSRLDFELMDAVGNLDKLVEKYNIPKEYLHVEITESAITKDIAGLKDAVRRLHEKGYVVWLDDFGSGYSSLNVLKDFDFDLLKIDMEFLRNFSGNENSRKIIQSVIDLAHSLDMKTLTEGVETEEAVEFLKEAGCGRLQGYFYGKPMPFEDILTKINDGTYVVSTSRDH